MHVSQCRVDGTAGFYLDESAVKDIGDADFDWQVFEVDEAAKSVQQVSERVDTRGGAPARLHGGALLGVTFASSMTSGARCCRKQHTPTAAGRCHHVLVETSLSQKLMGFRARPRRCMPDGRLAAAAGSRTGQALQFFSWRGGQRAVGSPIVEPRWLAWDPDVTLCALAYEASAGVLLLHCALVLATHVLCYVCRSAALALCCDVLV